MMEYSAGMVSQVFAFVEAKKLTELLNTGISKEEAWKKVQNENLFQLRKNDWDSFEISWDFKKHPLLQYASFTPQEIASDKARHISDMGLIRDAYELWNDKCECRFNQLKANEEELNRIFIDIYGLQDELIPDVEDKDNCIPITDDEYSEDDIVGSLCEWLISASKK